MMFTLTFYEIHYNMFVSIMWNSNNHFYIESGQKIDSISVTKGNLQHLQVNDDVLTSLMDYPLDAFEIYVDPQSGEESIRIKSAYRAKKNKVKGKTTKKKTKSRTSCSQHFISKEYLFSFFSCHYFWWNFNWRFLSDSWSSNKSSCISYHSWRCRSKGIQRHTGSQLQHRSG